jgi:MYXO-CTERM domain-containing protein
MVDVVVTNPDGQSGTLPDAFTYEPEPGGYAGWSCGCSAGGAPLVGLVGLLAFAVRRGRRRVARGASRAAVLMVACVGLSARAEEPPPSALVHMTATGFGELIGRTAGAELGVSAGLGHWVDLGLAATLGPRVGGRVTVALHPPRPASGLSPFLQLRGVLHPVPEGMGLGAGAWLGGAYEAGPGRVIFGFGGEYIAGPPQYIPYGVWFIGGYEFDLVRPDRPATSGLATLRGRVVDLEDKPVSAVVTFPGAPAPLGEKKFDASPTFEARIPPGEHTVEVRAPGYLVRGRSISAKAGETLVMDFTLRPEPAERQAELTDTQITIRQMVQFTVNEAKLLKESFAILDEVTDILLQHKGLRLRIEGHTDDQGGADFNRKLSQARAEAVRRYLIDWGVEPERLVAEGFGLTRPIATNATEAGRATNRRVQFTVLGR